MTDLASRKGRITHWGRLLAATMLVVAAFVAIHYGIPVYRQQQTLADFRTRRILVSAADVPEWLPKWIGKDWTAVVSSSLFIDTNDKKFTDEDLQRVAGMTNLKMLWLSRTQITDAGLAHLARLNKLTYLELERTQITDTGLVHLPRLINLEALVLDLTQVTDTGLPHLAGLTKLQSLSVGGTTVTRSGLVKLKAVLPGLRI